MKSFSCVHLSDIHFRGLSRHDEYREAFEDFFLKAKDLKPDVIMVGGDVVHSKTQGISPELVDILVWWFSKLSEIAPTHIILGNHDGLITNKDRQDAISPLINALNNPRLTLYKKSGVYPTGVPGYNWCVLSCFDEEGWADVKPVPGEINIALFHGAVRGSQIDSEYEIEGEVENNLFEGFDFGFLGDIHKFQYLDSAKRIAYPGSTLQQNYGEDLEKGFLYWQISSKDSYSSKFIPVKNPSPFITIDWQGSVMETARHALQFPNRSRFRVRHTDALPQAEIKLLYSELKEQKNASEIVFKFDNDLQAGSVDTETISTEDHNYHNPANILELIKQFYSNKQISEETWEKISGKVTKYCDEIGKSDPVRNVKWSVNSMKFDNTFGYGKENYINFDGLSGVIGLFGKNRIGKSSIPGTMMYGLYNSNDRGIVKNLHVINTRKSHCSVELDFTVNGQQYRLERQTVKNQNKSGEVSGKTHANIFQILPNGSLKDVSGEQRRDTDVLMQELIGTKEDFLLTSFASQGEMNNFIKQKSTFRKSTLANFLDLDIFDKICDMAKNESLPTKALIDRMPQRDWNVTISEKKSELASLKNERADVESQLESTKSRIEVLKKKSADLGADKLVTKEDVERIQRALDNAKALQDQLTQNLAKCDSDISAAKERLTKISAIKSQFPIEELKAKLAEQNDLERSILKLEHELEREKIELSSQQKSVKLLEQVPCGDGFPTCKFIKDSHKNKLTLDDQVAKCDQLKDGLNAIRKTLKKISEENYGEKIEKYQKVLDQENATKVSVANLESAKVRITRELDDAKKEVARLDDNLLVAKNSVVDVGETSEVSSLKKELASLDDALRNGDQQRVSLSEKIGLTTSNIAQLEKEQKEYQRLISEWTVFENIVVATNKRGIPLQVLSSELPKINSEISKILQGVVGFTVELEADHQSNSMDVFINYGDSRRIIECASGMEKMMASLAIRVALINVSSLPKSDMLIIDEGFGALDEMNVEACNRMLQSLKRWFRVIFVISHVDAVKDAVDNFVEITSNGKDSRVHYE